MKKVCVCVSRLYGEGKNGTEQRSIEHLEHGAPKEIIPTCHASPHLPIRESESESETPIDDNASPRPVTGTPTIHSLHPSLQNPATHLSNPPAVTAPGPARPRHVLRKIA